jgi:PKD repeat protein
MHQDSSCSKIWNLIAATPQNDFPEKIYLVNSFNDTILESPPSANDGSYFYNLQPGHYTLISDSGCSFPIVLDTFKRVWDHVLSYVTCAGQPVIEEYGYDTIQEGGYPGFVTYYGHDFRVSIFHNDSLVYGPDTLRYNNPAAYIFGYIQYHYPSDTGLYTYKVYSMPYGPGAYDSVTQQYYNISLTTPYDTICPIDTGSFIVTRSTVPFPYAQAVYKCNSALASPPMLSIYGGSVPYTVQIPGVDTIIMNTNSIAFPDTSQGTYNIIAYDNCGISRSFTFSIRDSCTCTAPSATWTSTHNGQNYAFNDSIISGSGPYSYSWTFGDGGTSSSPKPGHRYSTAGTYTVTLIIDNACGSDTVRRTITVATGINATSLDEHISVYPNPNHGSFTITVDEVPASALSAEITDVLGRSIFRQDIHIGKNEMSLNIESGLYLVKISDGENSTIRTMSIK